MRQRANKLRKPIVGRMTLSKPKPEQQRQLLADEEWKTTLSRNLEALRNRRYFISQRTEAPLRILHRIPDCNTAPKQMVPDTSLWASEPNVGNCYICSTVTTEGEVSEVLLRSTRQPRLVLVKTKLS